MSNHEHHCHHEFRFCSVCDVVYCKKCGSEWKRYWCWTTATKPLYSWNQSGTSLYQSAVNHAHPDTNTRSEYEAVSNAAEN